MKLLKHKKDLMETAKVWAKESHCKRNQVGAVITKESRIISTGYNDMPSGMENICEENGISKKEVIHAEANAILFAAKNGISTKGSTLYLTLSPCIECAKMIIQAGIKEVVYLTEYRDISGIELLKKCNISIQKYKE